MRRASSAVRRAWRHAGIKLELPVLKKETSNSI